MTLSTLLRHSKTHRKAALARRDLYYCSLVLNPNRAAKNEFKGDIKIMRARAVAQLLAARLPILKVFEPTRYWGSDPSRDRDALLQIAVAAPLGQRMDSLVSEGWDWTMIRSGKPETYHRVTREDLAKALSRG